MFFRGKRSGIIHNFTMDVNPGYKYIKNSRGNIHWYMMESKDNISSICFKLKNEQKLNSIIQRAKYHFSIINQGNLSNGYTQL